MLTDILFWRWNRFPPKARALFALAALLVCGAAGLLAERLYFRATASRVEGTVIDHDRRGRAVVDYLWDGQPHQYDEKGPSASLRLGSKVGVYVSPAGPSAVRLDGLVPLLFTPGWVCAMPAAFFAGYGLIIAFWDTRPRVDPVAKRLSR